MDYLLTGLATEDKILTVGANAVLIDNQINTPAGWYVTNQLYPTFSVNGTDPNWNWEAVFVNGGIINPASRVQASGGQSGTVYTTTFGGYTYTVTFSANTGTAGVLGNQTAFKVNTNNPALLTFLPFGQFKYNKVWTDTSQVISVGGTPSYRVYCLVSTAAYNSAVVVDPNPGGGTDPGNGGNNGGGTTPPPTPSLWTPQAPGVIPSWGRSCSGAVADWERKCG